MAQRCEVYGLLTVIVTLPKHRSAEGALDCEGNPRGARLPRGFELQATASELDRTEAVSGIEAVSLHYVQLLAQAAIPARRPPLPHLRSLS